jgi:outer membrane protein insertion porin family
LIYLNEGEPFSPARLQTSLTALKLSEKFKDITVEAEQIPQGMRLIFTLQPFHLVKKFRIRDNYPVFEQDIRKVMTMRVGDVFDVQKIAKQKEIIATLYQRRGFINPVIHIDPVQDPDDGNYVVYIKVEKGVYHTLKRIVFKGNQAFSDETLRQKMKIYRRSIFSGQIARFAPRILEADIEKLVKFYRSKKFLQIEIEHRVEHQAHAKTVIVTLTISEGPLYEVRFEGNNAFSNGKLRKASGLFESGNIRDVGLRRAMRNFRRLYREAGYLEAKISKKEERVDLAGTSVRRIRIDFEEGPRTLVESVMVEGNHALKSQRIRDQMLTRPSRLMRKIPFVPETLDEDLFMIRALYAELGFLDPTVTAEIDKNPDNTRAHVYIDIKEGVQTRVASLDIQGQLPVAEQMLREAMGLRVGDPYSEVQMLADANTLSALVSDAGYPHVKVAHATDFSADRTAVHITYAVTHGNFITMGEVFYTGNLRTKRRVLARIHGLAPDEPFSLKKTLEAQKEIRDMGIFDSVQFTMIGLKEQTETVHLIVDLEERKPYFFEVGVGYQSDRGVFGRGKIGDRNLWGLNKDLWVGGEINETGYKAETVLREPRLLESKIEMTISAFAEETEEFNQSFGTRIAGGSVNFAREVTEHIDAGLGFRYERRQQTPVEGSPKPEDAYAPRSNLVTTPFMVFDNRDSFVRPSKGLFSEFKIDLSKGIENSRDDFTKYRIDLRHFTTPFKRLTLALMGRAGTVRPHGDNSIIPADQRFYLGGINSVRGYDENLLFFDANGDALGGQSALNGSIEGRIDIGYSFGLTTFFDTGSVIQDPDFKDVTFRSSVGFGLLYQTVIGPIGVYYGWKIDPEPVESAGQWHFTIGYTY